MRNHKEYYNFRENVGENNEYYDLRVKVEREQKVLWTKMNR
jgi:hypothetical protein